MDKNKSSKSGYNLRVKVQKDAISFIENLKMGSRKACVVWPYHRYKNGYAYLNLNKHRLVVSRMVCEKFHGPPPSSDFEAAHSCGNGHLGCVNPSHLRWRTRSQNQMERVQHGTSNRGERHGIAKLNAKTVIEIRNLLIRGHSQTSIAAKFEISQVTVSDINRRKTWAWLGDSEL